MRRLYFLILMCLCLTEAQAQKLSKRYIEKSLSDVLIDLNKSQSACRISFIYDELEDFTVTTSFKNCTINEAVLNVVGFYPMKIITVDTLITVECTQKESSKVIGRVVDEHKAPIAFANISLLSVAPGPNSGKNSTFVKEQGNIEVDGEFINGSVSNENGDFVIPCQSQHVMIKVSCIGYKTVKHRVSVGEIGTITLHPETYTVKGVEVKGEIPLYKTILGGLTVEVQHSILHDVGTADDLLSMMPLIQGRDGKFSVIAKGEPEIYINNKKVRDPSELKQLKSTDIKSVDIITSPGAQYNAEVNAVVRIKTIRQQGDGFSVQVMSDTYRNNQWNTFENLAVKYRVDGFETFANIGFQNEHQGVDLTGDIENNINNHTINIHQTAPIDNWITVFSGKTGVSYDFDNDNSIGMSYGTQITAYAAGSLHSEQNITRNGQTDEFVDQWRRVRQSDPPSHDINAYYVGKIGKLGVDLNASYVWRKIKLDHDVSEFSAELDDRTITSHSQDKRRLLAGKLVLTYPLWKGMMSGGSEVTHTNSYGTNTTDEGIIPPSENEVKESNTAAFAEYEMQLGQWRLNAGLRYEHVSTDYSSFGVHQEAPSRTYNDLFPNLSAGWQKGMWGLQLSFSKRITRPPYNWLINTVQYDNRYMYEGGNPLLRPTIRRSIDFSATYSWFNFMTGFTRENDFFTHISKVYDEAKEIAIIQHMNFDHQIRWYATLTASPKIGFWQPTLRLHYYQQKFDAEAYGVPMKLNKPEFSVNLQSWFVIDETAKALLQVDYTGSNHWGFMYRNSNFAVNARLQKSFLKGSLVAALYANDIFRTERNDYTTYCAIGKTTSSSYVYSQEIGLSLSYNFNVTRSKYKGTGAGNEEKNRL
ncbi:MAG: TonB-dependent receptor family protein [Prevotella sp.]|nr:TonB-dependent receptor family protein [Prevotella sp.]